MNANSGYREIEHTADWELQVWGPDLESLLKTAAKGMYELSQTKLVPSPKVERNFVIPILDQESLIVDFLSELLYFGEDEGIAFDHYDMRFDDNMLTVQAFGAQIQAQQKEIKAVTYHGMSVLKTKLGLEVRIVFDV